MFKTCGIAWIYKPRFLSTLHLSNANCIIISNRRTINPSTSANSGEVNQQDSRNIYSEFESENVYSNGDDLDENGSKINNFDDEDRICLSHFSPYDE
jgi:type V secretory pathway adhesin AidA